MAPELQEDAGKAAGEAGELREENEDLREEIAFLKQELDPPFAREFDKPVGARSDTSAKPVDLAKALGVKGEHYSQDIAELDPQLISKRLTAKQAA